jgi:putative DNA primase/helicase
MTMQELAAALGGFWNGAWINIPGPGHSNHDHSLGFCFDPLQPDGIRISSFAGDDPVTCRKLIKSKLHNLGATDSFIFEEYVNHRVDHAKQIKIEMGLSLWHESAGAQGTIVENYLTLRGCAPLSAACLNDALRFHACCPMRKQYVPAMIAVMHDVITGEPSGIHRTALLDDGSGKRTMLDGMPGKLMLGRAKRAAVMLGARAPIMGIAEGIETALSAQKIFGIPVWACMSAPGIAGFPALHGLSHLTIFADHDQAGIKAAKACARRYQEHGIDAEVRYPDQTGDDWNSFLLKESA